MKLHNWAGIMSKTLAGGMDFVCIGAPPHARRMWVNPINAKGEERPLLPLEYLGDRCDGCGIVIRPPDGWQGRMNLNELMEVNGQPERGSAELTEPSAD